MPRRDRRSAALRGGSRVLWQMLRRMRVELDDETLVRLERWENRLQFRDYWVKRRHIALKRGCNVDQPRNLAKSVTVE